MSTGPSLYRRHRPRTFTDMVGQEQVVRTLSNAITRGKVHHAYLFVGSRGTGKTSTAKILAASLNCEQGPTITPCGVCESCVSIANATSMDVIEMDAASNNSVDDIRDLRERVAYAPLSGRHKVYILDEAHMLSPQAWNAFLKTLEEPPPRTIFVLATTEAQKVLPTVVDRCHRFDFGRPTVEQVATVVGRVAATEQISIEQGAVALIARHATGSFRDALGTLEQLLTYAGDEEQITSADVLAVLGVADAEQLFEALDAVIAHDPAAALRSAASLTSAGRDPGQILRDLEVHGRELLAVKMLEEVPEELRVTPERDQRLARPGPGAGRHRHRAPAGPRLGRAGGHRQRRPAADPARARAHQGHRPRGRPVGGRAAGAHRAPRSRAGRAAARAAAGRDGCRPSPGCRPGPGPGCRPAPAAAPAPARLQPRLPPRPRSPRPRRRPSRRPTEATPRRPRPRLRLQQRRQPPSRPPRHRGPPVRRSSRP